MLCCRSVLFHPAGWLPWTETKNQFLSKNKIFRGLKSGFNLVVELWAGCLSPLLVSDESKLKTLPNNGKLLKSSFSDYSLFTTITIIFWLAANTLLFKRNPQGLILELFFPPPLLTSIPLSHSFGSLTLNSINTLKIKTDSHGLRSYCWIDSQIMWLNNSCFLCNMLRRQMCPGFNLLASTVRKGELSGCAVLFLLLHRSWSPLWPCLCSRINCPAVSQQLGWALPVEWLQLVPK